jgi:hypothetical protein
MVNEFNNFGLFGSVICTINKLLLRGGNYTLRLFATYNGNGEDCILDEINDALSFEVEGVDFYGRGRILRNKLEAFFPSEFKSKP